MYASKASLYSDAEPASQYSSNPNLSQYDSNNNLSQYNSNNNLSQYSSNNNLSQYEEDGANESQGSSRLSEGKEGKEEEEEEGDEDLWYRQAEEELDLELDNYVEGTLSPRFKHWVIFMLLSIVSTFASVDASNYATNAYEEVSAQRYTIACSSLTLIFTATIVAMHMSSLTSIFIINTRLEGTLILILTAFWAAIVGVVSNSQTGLAINRTTQIVQHGNLYYFSWFGFMYSLYLGKSYTRDVFLYDMAEELRARGSRLTFWIVFLIFSVIEMGSAAYVFDHICVLENNRYSVYCRRTVFGVCLGAIGSVVSLVMIGVKVAMLRAMVPLKLEMGISAALFLMYVYGVTFVTSENGPGAPLGNLYYSIWAAMLTLFVIGASCYEEYRVALVKRREELEEQKREMELEEEMYHNQGDVVYEGDDYEDQTTTTGYQSGRPDGQSVYTTEQDLQGEYYGSQDFSQMQSTRS